MYSQRCQFAPRPARAWWTDHSLRRRDANGSVRRKSPGERPTRSSAIFELNADQRCRAFRSRRWAPGDCRGPHSGWLATPNYNGGGSDFSGGVRSRWGQGGLRCRAERGWHVEYSAECSNARVGRLSLVYWARANESNARGWSGRGGVSVEPVVSPQGLGLRRGSRCAVLRQCPGLDCGNNPNEFAHSAS